MTRATLVLVSDRLNEEGDWCFVVRCPRRTEMEIRVGNGSPDIQVTHDEPQPTDQTPPPPGDSVGAVSGGSSKVADAIAKGTIPEWNWSTADVAHFCLVCGIDQDNGTKKELMRNIALWKARRDAAASAEARS